MSFLDQNFWALFQDFRVLAIFDGIHHCADHESGLSNSWGQMIVQRVQDSASYTLAMSGTPWRSDDLGIALARYSSPDGKLICDYRYALAEAVEDRVCRSPRIVLLDNEDVRLKVSNLETSDEKHFSSVADLLADSSVRYQDLLENTKTLEHILSEANARLDLLRARNADAAGLVVASTIRHARMIANVLNSIGEFATVVCSDSKNARDAIQQFRVGAERWIIAVGMIAEGTDVPRIQVCCHLSRIRTELHFRQVLGRSLRRRGGTDSLAWMYLYAEPALEVFAQRVADDLPADKSVLVDGRLQVMTGSVVESGSMSIRDVELLLTDNEGHAETTLILDGDSQREAKTLVVSEYFRHQLLAIFSS